MHAADIVHNLSIRAVSIAAGFKNHPLRSKMGKVISYVRVDDTVHYHGIELRDRTWGIGPHRP